MGETMKKKILFLFTFIILIITLIIGSHIIYDNKKVVPIKPAPVQKIPKEDYSRIINDLQTKHNNNDIVALIEIPNVLEEPIVQTNNNDYYLHNDINKNENIIGASFLDYRNDLTNSKKLLIYSHSDPEGTLPFVKLTNYNNEDFFKENKYIYLIDSLSKRKYEVFASYIESEDFDYVNLESFNGLTYKEHLEKLKNKSYVKTNIELNNNSKVLILQTCSFNNTIHNIDKFQLVIAKEIDNN